jgi:bifunctional ADP-heptose synthase (sugar kinase/adenylyltransferase)
VEEDFWATLGVVTVASANNTVRNTNLRKKHKENRLPVVVEKIEVMKVGITFSTFDLLHAGHVKMLEEAKRQCDYLIVGL